MVIAGDVDRAAVPAIEARSREFPGVLIQPEHKRYYPKGLVAAHALGYVGEINQAQLDAWGRDRYRMGDIVGQARPRASAQRLPVGARRRGAVVVNSAGRTVQVLNQMAPEPGKTLTLTLDLALQQQAEALLEGKKGAIVVIDVNTGGVLALASAPAFDPNMFARRFSSSEWDALTSDPAKPMQNRALQSAYPPGSIFKLMMAVAGLENGVITPETTAFCPGGGNYFGQWRACHLAGGHGTVDLREAIRRSCNVYFYEIGAKLGRDARNKILDVAQRYGLGARTGIDLLNEGRGLLPTDEWVAESSADGRWYPARPSGCRSARVRSRRHRYSSPTWPRPWRPASISRRTSSSAKRNRPPRRAYHAGLRPHETCS